jgi:hypothetical protein
MKSNIFLYIFLINLLFIRTSFAQEISSTNSKNYETKTVKKDNEIEIRLIPKNPPVIAPKNPPAKVDNLDDEDLESLDAVDDTDLDNQEVADEKDQEMVYKKNSDGNNFSAKELADIKAKNSNIARGNSLNLWREEQKRLREERIKSRKEESRKKYQAQKERSVIKEIENLNQNLKNEEGLKNDQNLGGSNVYVPNQIKSSNTVIVPVVNPGSTPPTSNNSSSTAVNPVATPPSNNSSSTAVNPVATPPSNNSSSTAVNPVATPPSNNSTQPSR